LTPGGPRESQERKKVTKFTSRNLMPSIGSFLSITNDRVLVVTSQS
jgi:hypothetical protein